MEKVTITASTNKSVFDFTLKVGDATFTFNVTAESEAAARVKLSGLLFDMSNALKTA